jgi:hypothetical protein
MFDPCLANVPKIEEHDELGKANLEYENKKKNQLMNIVMCQKQAKIILVIHSCASQGKVFRG